MSGEEARGEQQSGARAGAAQGYTSDLSRDAALHVYETVFLHAAFGIAIIDSVRQLVQFANPAFARMHGYSGAEITGKRLLALVAPEDAGMWEEANRIISGTGHHVFEWTHLRKDGTQFPCSVDMTAVRDPQGLPLYWFASFKDITDRRRAEAALRETEATLESFYDSSPMFMGVAELEEDDIVLVYENKTAAAFVGSTREELRGRLASEVGAPRGMIRLWIQHYRRSQTEGAPVRFEYEQPMAAGARWVSATVSFIGMADSGRPRFSYVAEDITDRKQAEHALRESEQRYRSLFENSLDAIFSIDVNGRFRTANPAGIALSGYSLDELRERTFADLCAPEHLEKTMQAFLADLRGEQREIETEMIRRDGARVKVFVSGVPVRAGEKIVGVFGIARDIGSHKAAEEAMRESDERLRLAAHVARFGTYDRDLVAGTRIWSPEAKALFGLPPDAVITDALIRERLHPDDYERVLRLQAASFDPRGSGEFSTEHRVVWPDGTTHWLQVRGRTFFGGEGAERRARRAVGVTQDITAQKAAGQTLREGEALLRAVCDGTEDAIFVKDRASRILMANPATLRIIGKPVGQVLGHSDRDFYDDPQIGEAIMENDRRIMESGRTEVVEETVDSPQGRRIYLSTKSPQRDAEGNVIGLIGIARDITERKRAEEILRDAHRLLEERVRERTAELSGEKTKLDAILESTTDLIAALDPDFRFIAFNEAYRHQIHQRYGSRITLGMRLQDALNGAPAQLAKSQELWGRAFEGEEFAVEYTVDAGEREAQRIYETHFNPIRSPQGKITGASLFARDITERERVLEALRESEARWRSLSASAPIGIFLCDADGRCTYTNTRWQHLAGLTLDESLGDRWVLALHPADRAGVLSEWLACAHEGREYAREFRFVWPDGTVRWVRGRATALHSPGGELLGFVGTNEDITGHKDAEEALHRRSEELAAANRNLEAFTYSVSHDLRAPLRGILGFSRALVQDYDDRLDDNGLDSLRRIDAAAQRMSALIDDLLQLSRLGRHTLRRHRVDLAAMAREIDSELRAAHPEREVRFTAPPQIWTSGDPGLLRSLLTNLIENAWKFTAHRPSAQIEFGCERNPSSGETCFFVRDNGAGFEMADAGLLFTPFRRLHATEKFPGEGIGLATVQRIVARHGGRIWAEAAPDQGATFFFELSESK